MLLVSFRPHSSRLRGVQMTARTSDKMQFIEWACVCVCVFTTQTWRLILIWDPWEIRLACLLTCTCMLALGEWAMPPLSGSGLCPNIDLLDLVRAQLLGSNEPHIRIGTQTWEQFHKFKYFLFFFFRTVYGSLPSFLITLIFNHHHFTLSRLPFVEQHLSFCERFVMKYIFHGQTLAYST